MDLRIFTPWRLEQILADLRVARHYVSEAWTQRQRFINTGDGIDVCPIGACALSAGGMEELLRPITKWSVRTRDLLQVLVPYVPEQNIFWTQVKLSPDHKRAIIIARANDRKDTTKQDVLGWFDAAITEVEAAFEETEEKLLVLV
jgi:hypothetical protein